MDVFLKRTVTTLLLQAVCLCVSGVFLFFAESLLMSTERAVQQVPFIVLVATLFFALSLFGNTIYLSLIRKGSKAIMGYYLLSKVLRLLLAVALLVIYALAVRDNLLAFALNILVLYVVEMVLSVVHCAKMERNIQKK